MKIHNLATILLTVFIVSFILSFFVLKVFSFEIGVIFSICLAVGFIMSGLVGIENTIILAKGGDKKNLE